MLLITSDKQGVCKQLVVAETVFIVKIISKDQWKDFKQKYGLQSQWEVLINWYDISVLQQ